MSASTFCMPPARYMPKIISNPGTFVYPRPKRAEISNYLESGAVLSLVCRCFSLALLKFWGWRRSEDLGFVPFAHCSYARETDGRFSRMAGFTETSLLRRSGICAGGGSYWGVLYGLDCDRSLPCSWLFLGYLESGFRWFWGLHMKMWDLLSCENGTFARSGIWFVFTSESGDGQIRILT